MTIDKSMREYLKQVVYLESLFGKGDESKSIPRFGNTELSVFRSQRKKDGVYSCMIRQPLKGSSLTLKEEHKPVVLEKSDFTYHEKTRATAFLEFLHSHDSDAKTEG